MVEMRWVASQRDQRFAPCPKRRSGIRTDLPQGPANPAFGSSPVLAPAARLPGTPPPNTHTQAALSHFCLSRRKPPCVTPDPPGPPSNAYVVISPPSNADAVGRWTTARILHSPAYSYTPRADTSALTAHFSFQTPIIRAAKSSLFRRDSEARNARHAAQTRETPGAVRPYPLCIFCAPSQAEFHPSTTSSVEHQKSHPVPLTLLRTILVVPRHAACG